jgi:hypothetical protein
VVRKEGRGGGRAGKKKGKKGTFLVGKKKVHPI